MNNCSSSIIQEFHQAFDPDVTVYMDPCTAMPMTPLSRRDLIPRRQSMPLASGHLHKPLFSREPLPQEHISQTTIAN